MSAIVCHPNARPERFDFSSTTTPELSNRYSTVIRKLRCVKEQWFLSDKLLHDLTNKLRRINKVDNKDFLCRNQRSGLFLTFTMRKFLVSEYLPSLKAEARSLHQELHNRGLYLRRFRLEDSPHELPVRSSESYVTQELSDQQGHSQGDDSTSTDVNMDSLDSSTTHGATCRLTNAPFICPDAAA